MEREANLEVNILSLGLNYVLCIAKSRSVVVGFFFSLAERVGGIFKMSDYVTRVWLSSRNLNM